MHTIKETRAINALVDSVVERKIELDVGKLHADHEAYFKFLLRSKYGVPVENVDDVYADALVTILRVGQREFNQKRGAAVTYANQKIWSASTAFHKKNNKKLAREVANPGYQSQSEELEVDDVLEFDGGCSVDETGIALRQFELNLRRLLNTRERKLLDHFGLHQLQIGLNEREAEAEALNISPIMIGRGLAVIRKKAASIWAEHFESGLPKLLEFKTSDEVQEQEEDEVQVAATPLRFQQEPAFECGVNLSDC